MKHSFRCSRTVLAGALVLSSLSALAADYYIVTPVAGRTAMATDVQVTLNAATLPAGLVSYAYDRFALSSLLSVTGDPSYSGSGVQWLVTAGSLPAGMTLNADGSLSGTPTASGTFSLTLQASYRGKSATQSYSLSVTPVYVVAQASGTRTWADGTLAASCLEYRSGKRGYEYAGATGDGIYRIQPSGVAMDVYCDMSTDGGGWTLLMKQAKNDGVTLQGDTAYWTAGTTLNDTVANLNTTDANLVSKAFSTLSVTQLRLQASNESTAQFNTVPARTPMAAFSNANRMNNYNMAPTPGTAPYPNWFIRTTKYPNGQAITVALFEFNFMAMYGTDFCGARWGWAANQDPLPGISTHDACGGLGAYGARYGEAHMGGNKNAWQPGTLYLWGK